MSIDYGTILTEIEAVAREAGEITQGYFTRFRDIDIEVKGPADFVSHADRDSEMLIRQRLLGRYPEWSFTGEEFDSVTGSDPEHLWLVDPIDGTTNFLNGMHYTISIALRRGDQTMCGALYNPVADEMFTAVKGQGAWLNGERISVSRQTDPRFFAVGTGLPTSNLSLYPGAYDRLAKLRDPIGAVRIVGSSANSCAYVACGRLTGYYEQSGLVDWAVGVLLIEEAGGVVTDWWGRGPEHYDRSGVVAVGNPACHAYLLEQLGDTPRPEGM
jgi:myo-inositol-1(or 4)-monophosphatase